MLDYLLDIQRVNQYFKWPLGARMLWDATANDLQFVRQVRAGLVPLPTDRPGPFRDPFPPRHRRRLKALADRRVAVIATGGSGALASMVGVVRVLEEADVRPAAYAVCSGSALFGVPLAAGLGAEEVARATQALTARDYLDPDWAGLLAAPWRLLRGWAGLLDGDRLERTYRKLLGDVTLAELPTPVWMPVWNIERNHLEYLGPDTHPDMAAAHAVRMAVALPLAIKPSPMADGYYLDGGIVEILPARPFTERDLCDVAIVVNGFYAEGFVADEEPGWRTKPLSVLHMANQTRTMQHLHLAKRSLADLHEHVDDVIELTPVPYDIVQGAGLYGQFLDNRRWPEFMTDGYEAAAMALPAFRPARSVVRTQIKR